MQPGLLSEMLTRVAGVIYTFDREDRPTAAAWKAAADAALAKDEGDDWTYAADRLAGRLPLQLTDRLAPPFSEAEFTNLVRCLQMLDRWHAPLTGDENNIRPEPTSDHDLLAIDIAVNGYIAKTDQGMLIPAYASLRSPGARGASWQEARLEDWNAVIKRINKGDDSKFPPISRQDLLSSLLQYTAFIPGTLDDCRSRPLTLTYRQPLPGETDAVHVARGDKPWKIGIAPMALSDADVQLDLQPLKNGDTAYGIVPIYPDARIDAVLDEAVAEGVEILLIPEMALPVAGEARIRERIRQLRKTTPIDDYRLRYIVAGVAALPTPAAITHTNAVVMLNGLTGARIMFQHKLYGWDLNPTQMTRMGLQHRLDPLPPTLFENITHGDELTILDIPDFGRFSALICADMSEAHPGDWLLRSLSLDWLYSPIMDINTPCVKIDDKRANWIVHRATRAACSGKTRVMVTNSTALSSLTDIENNRLKNGYSCFPSGIGFMLDAAGASLRFGHFEHLKDEPPPPAKLLYVFDWNAGWNAYDDDVA